MSAAHNLRTWSTLFISNYYNFFFVFKICYKESNLKEKKKDIKKWKFK